MDRAHIDNYQKLLDEIERLGCVENLRELENRIIQEIVDLVVDGSDPARRLLARLEELITKKLSYAERNKVLQIALRKSISGAFKAAKHALL